MNSLSRRIDALEKRLTKDDDPMVSFFGWAEDGPISRATCAGESLRPTHGEPEEDFRIRATAWARGLDGEQWARVVWIERA